MGEDERLRVAQVLAMQRRIDLGDDERLGDDGTREGYWRAITEREQELMLLRADSVIAAMRSSHPDALRSRKDGE